MKTKIIANYLPQYHQTEENDKWWGEGYTDWVAVKKSIPLYQGHVQPKVPLNNNYYSLDDVEVLKWQAKMAKDHGIYGFGIYHYWFSDDLCVLDKPLRILRDCKEIDINYMFIWDNASWKRTWSAVRGPANAWAPTFEGNVKKQGTKESGILAELRYGERESWKKHFDYLLPFFKDERYIKIDEKPVFAFFNPDNQVEVLRQMTTYWNELAKQNGFNGILFIGKYKGEEYNYLDYSFLYEPEWNGWKNKSIVYRAYDYFNRKYVNRKKPLMYNYDKIWRKIIQGAKRQGDSSRLCSAFVAYDDTPRRGCKGRVVSNSSPQKFERYFHELLKVCNENNNDFLFLVAWNEWGEGAYLEPDEENKYAYLEAVKDVTSMFE